MEGIKEAIAYRRAGRKGREAGSNQDQRPDILHEGSQALRRSRQGRADQGDHSHLSGGLHQGKPRGTPRQNDHSGGKRHKGAALLRTAGRARP